jgi:hypothetical protein
MRPRQITTHGWSVEDDLRADRITQERADEVDREPRRADKTPYMADLMKTSSPGSQDVTVFFRPSADTQSKTWKDEP